MATIESRDIPVLVLERFPVFAGTWDLYYPGGDASRRPGLVGCLAGLAIYAARLAASRDEAGLDRVLRFIEEVHEEGSRGAVGVVVTFFLEILAGGLNELGVHWADIEALAGPKTRESVGQLSAGGFWDGIVLPRAFSELLR